MKRSRLTEEQIIGISREQEAGLSTADVCSKHGSAARRFTRGRPSSASSRSEIAARQDRIDVEENVLPSEATRKAIIDSPRESAGIVTPIADEDTAHHIDASATKDK
jgi:putative transposase